MKKLLKELPTMTAPIAGETLILYLAASKEAISSVLIEDRGQVQMPVYFISKALTGSELNYPAIEKMVYALVHTARLLRRYFQVHPIRVLTDQPIKQVKEVKVKSIEEDSVSAAVEEEERSWMTPIIEFLTKGMLPIASSEARKIKMKAPMYLLDKGVLYRKSFLGPHLKCLNPTQSESIIREVHEGMCALHSGHKTVASKIMRIGYYWPSMYRCAKEENIVCQFGIPNEIVSENGTQFEGNPFSGWCQELNIKQTFTSVAHPQANGQCEVTNRDIVLGIKARCHRTTLKGATNETPFSLVYGSEAVIPAEINVPTMRITSFDESSNSEELRENLNLVEERREMAVIKEAINKQRITSYYNKRVQPLSFQLDDLVWRKNEASRAEDTGKLGPKWEGPYKVIGVSDTGAYRLASLDGRAIKRSWHAQTLKRCYI
ncbi:uncharacterized protein [Rutidosis leptorrhynchoides]|uniref:uncharacterized protein n=1 Tax=Rutidosis leptorrhynchoides TaxID=125765 RepID=UPI003A99612B